MKCKLLNSRRADDGWAFHGLYKKGMQMAKGIKHEAKPMASLAGYAQQWLPNHHRPWAAVEVPRGLMVALRRSGASTVDQRLRGWAEILQGVV